jgi:hypothetical protein
MAGKQTLESRQPNAVRREEVPPGKLLGDLPNRPGAQARIAEKTAEAEG